MFKIYFDNKYVVLTNKDIDDNQKNFDLYYKFQKKSDLHSLIKAFLKSENIESWCIYSEDISLLFKKFKKYFKYIKAAGGVVLNTKKDILWIYRLGKWDLPKGKIENYETPQISAIREVEEECGISKPAILRELSSTYHIYLRSNKWHLKRTYWYLMTYVGSQKLKPQTEEGITMVEWLGDEKLEEIKKNTYPSIISVLNNVKTNKP